MKSVISTISLIVVCCGAASAQSGESALEFNGSSYIVNDAAADIRYAPPAAARLDNVSNTFTIEMWLSPEATHEIDGEGRTGAAGTSGQRYAIWPTHIVGGSFGVGVGISVGTNGVSVYEHGDDYMPALAVWQGSINGCTHIAVVYENKQPRLYVNGELVRTGITSTAWAIHPSIDRFGAGSYGGFVGTIDEIRIWNVALTEEQIGSRMDAPLEGDETDLVFYLPLNEGSGTATDDASSNGSSYTLVDGPEWTTPCISTPDVTPPTISCSVSPATLWSPDHTMQSISATITATDNGTEEPSVVLVSVTSNEPDNGVADGDTENDIQNATTGTDDRSFDLRAERAGTGLGRVYTIVYRATDASGNSATCTTCVFVPHDLGKPATPDDDDEEINLAQNEPNPVTGMTNFTYAMAEGSRAVHRLGGSFTDPAPQRARHPRDHFSSLSARTGTAYGRSPNPMLASPS